MPATPRTGKVVIRRFRFEACFVRATLESSVHAEEILGRWWMTQGYQHDPRLQRRNCAALQLTSVFLLYLFALVRYL